MESRASLEHVEQAAASGEPAAPLLAYLAGRGVHIPEDELNAARRRALLILAAGGDPRRGLDSNSSAVRRLADDLDTAERRRELRDAAARLRGAAAGLPRAAAALDALVADAEQAWRWLACALLADEPTAQD